MNGCQRSEELSCHNTKTRHLGGGWPVESSLKWQKELLLIQRTLKFSKPTWGNSPINVWRLRKDGITGLEWMMWSTLLKATQRMIFAYHRKWMGPMVSPLWRWSWTTTTKKGDPWEIGTMAVQTGNKVQLLGMFQPSYLPEIQIRLVIGYFRLSISERKFATQTDDMNCEIIEMNYDSKLQNMSWFFYAHVNTLSKTSMTT